MGISREGGGGDSAFKVLELLADPTKFQQHLADLRAAEEKAREAIDALGPVADINAMREETAQAKHAANEALISANAEATRILEDASEQASEMRTIALEEANAIKAQATQSLANADKARTELMKEQQLLALKLQDADALKASLEEQTARANALIAENEQIRVELDAERERLQAIVASVNASLAA